MLLPFPTEYNYIPLILWQNSNVGFKSR